MKFFQNISIALVFFGVQNVHALSSGSMYLQDTSFSSLLVEHSSELTFHQGQITGADSLIRAGQASKVFMFGENHGVREIARFADLLYTKLSANRPRVLVTEIGPATAEEAALLVRENRFEAFMRKRTNLHAVPFFFLEQEVPLLKSAVSQFDSIGFTAVWGLDQEFIAGAPVVFNRLEKLATTEQEIKAVKVAKRKAFFNPFLIGMGSGQALEDLREAFRESTSVRAKRITDQLVLSHDIYKKQMGDDPKWSNERRETLMMENFLHYHHSTGDSLPDLFLKFGSFHLHKGKSPTVQEALGFRIHQWAKDQGWNTTSLMVDAVSGQTLDPLMGGKKELPSVSQWQKSPFYSVIKDQPVLFDLRAIKGHPEVKTLPRRMQIMIAGYDFLVLFPEATAQNFLEGTLVTHAYGIALIVGIALVLSLIIYFIVRWVKKRRRNRRKADAISSPQ